MADQKHVLFSLLVLFSCFVCNSFAYQFVVGGRDGWVVNPSEAYNHWAERNRFQVNDTLLFKYKSGSNSVLVVNKDDYDKCNTGNPIRKLDDANSVFQFDRSGPFYFISGDKASCDQGQKLIVVVMAVRTPPLPPRAPSPTTAPPKGSSPSPSPNGGASTPAPAGSPLSPSPSPNGGASTPAPAGSPLSPSPSPNGGASTPAPAGSPMSPSPSPTTGAPAPAGSPFFPPTGAPAPGTQGSGPSPAANSQGPSSSTTPGAPGSSTPGSPTSSAPGSGTPGSGTPADVTAPPPRPRSLAAPTGTPSIVLISMASLILSVVFGVLKV